MNDSNNFKPVIVIFGITGDLSKRKLLPAIYDLFKENILDPESSIIGTSRRQLDKDELLKTEELGVLQTDKQTDPETLLKFKKSFQAIQIDPEKDEDYDKLKSLLDSLDENGQRQRLFYMSIPSSAYEPIVDHLASHKLNDQRSRVLLEKPFGHDLASAEASIKSVHQAFNEDQIYRIDHYLAKETSQNLLDFRLNNPIFKDIWSDEFIKSVHITQHETLGIEGRADFYEQTGALRDVIQSHLIQLLAVTLMENPKSLNSEDIHVSKQEFLETLNVAEVGRASRGQYDGYKKQVNNSNSYVETYARIELSSSAEAWKNTEIILEHGKAMPSTIAKIEIEFTASGQDQSNFLTFQVQPNDGITLSLAVKVPGLNHHISDKKMKFRYKNDFESSKQYDAYEKVLVDAIKGDQSLFASDEEVLSSWRAVEAIVKAWTANGEGLKSYSAKAKEFDLY
jgi:glucose-6-phosphate 1-dehydrogenase